MKIGQYLRRIEAKDPHIASDRIRGRWIMNFCPEMEEWREGQEYDAVIFHTPSAMIEKTHCLKILDVCDPMWHNVEEFRRRVKSVDGIVACTEELRVQVEQIIQKPVTVIGDGHYFPHYETKVLNGHGSRAKTVVWFGYADNASSLVPLLPFLVAKGLQIKFISERNPFPGHTNLHFCRWNLENYVHDISQADFAVLPSNKSYKSNNKDITAMLCGIPVAKTAEDVERLMDPAERRKEMELAAAIVAQHNAKDRAVEYMDFINKLRVARDARELNLAAPGTICEYTAICGGYDKPREPVLGHTIAHYGDGAAPVFQHGHGFQDPVMNAKVYKVLPHHFMGAPIRIWMDGNIYPQKPAPVLVRELLQDYDIAVFKHPWRNCIYDEHEPARLRLHQEKWRLIDDQIKMYAARGMPRKFGLAECGVILSRANEITREFFERWWAEITRFSSRDQMSFPFVWWQMRNRIRIRLIEAKTRFGEWFKYVERSK